MGNKQHVLINSANYTSRPATYLKRLTLMLLLINVNCLLTLILLICFSNLFSRTGKVTETTFAHPHET